VLKKQSRAVKIKIGRHNKMPQRTCVSRIPNTNINTKYPARNRKTSGNRGTAATIAKPGSKLNK
jgi:hypothetical protein